MIKLCGNDIQKSRHLFENFDFYQPFIFSIFENQFDGFVYVDKIEDMNWALLQTPFLQHIIAGKPTEGCESIIEEILFSIVLKEQTEEEIVIFNNNYVWDNILKGIFEKRKGVSDSRKIFNFSFENLVKIKDTKVPENIEILTEKCITFPNSKFNTWSTKILYDKNIVSHCDAVMVGKNMAEIDIGTDEHYRGKGYATIAAIKLIEKLLEEKIIPCWSTWTFRLESQHIAIKLGFIPQPDVKAWIWLKSMQE